MNISSTPDQTALWQLQRNGGGREGDGCGVLKEEMPKAAFQSLLTCQYSTKRPRKYFHEAESSVDGALRAGNNGERPDVQDEEQVCVTR